MTADITALDAHEQPSEHMRAVWKAYSKADQRDLNLSGSIDDLQDTEHASEFCQVGSVSKKTLNQTFAEFLQEGEPDVRVEHDAPIFYHPLLPGLLVLPSILPPEIQKIMLSRLVHRDLSDPQHQTNMHLHFNLPYPPDGASFFSHEPEAEARFVPKDPSVHKPLTMKQVMDRRLHWVTLGGQYDWTNRVYPDGEHPPTFPSDIARLLESLFPDTKAEAAIVNFYTPGDTMMMHRDVSEESDKGLVSISLGCDGLFMISPNNIGKVAAGEEWQPTEDGKKDHLLLRLRSGDAIYMTDDSRFAWHGVPKVVKGTCPDFLSDWPAEDGNYEGWRGWMRNKRINLNVRQMRD